MRNADQPLDRQTNEKIIQILALCLNKKKWRLIYQKISKYGMGFDFEVRLCYEGIQRTLRFHRKMSVRWIDKIAQFTNFGKSLFTTIYQLVRTVICKFIIMVCPGH